ncbi:MAG: glycosyltransferase [Flavobacteriaceae bacterium]
MKIIRLSTFLDYGGIETKMVNLSNYETEKEEWVFCAIGKGGSASKTIAENGKRVVCFNLNHKIPSIKTIYQLYLFFKKEKPEVVHTSGAEANFHGVIAAKLASVPKIIAEEIGITSQSKFAKKIFYWIYKYAHYVVGESKLVTNSLQLNYRIPSKKLKTIHNFISFPEITPNRFENVNSLSIVSISRLAAVKNILGVLEAVSLLKKEGFPVQYSIAGDGAQLDILKLKTKELGIEDCVTFVGYIKNPYPLLTKSKIFVLNSFTEGFSNSLLEAMYSGTPAISTAVGGAPEIITEGKNGWLVPVADTMALYHKMKQIHSLNYLTLEEIGKESRKTVISRFSLQSHVKELGKLYYS